MSERAQQAWRLVLREMGDSEVLTGADTHILRIYCESFGRYVEAVELYDQTTPLIRKHGVLAKNPLHQIVRDNADQVRVLARELGLSPAARANLQMMPGGVLPDINAELGLPPRLRVVPDAV